MMMSLSALFNPAARRAHRAFAHAKPVHAARTRSGEPMPELPHWVEDAIFDVYVGSPDPAIPVTEDSCITMALLRCSAVVLADGVVIPGYDNDGNYGYLVFQLGVQPFHSRAATARLALVEARRAQLKMAKIDAQFSEPSALELTAQRMPRLAWCNLSDIRASGASDWSIETYLRRNGLWSAAHVLDGVPLKLLWLSSATNRRVIAANIMRAGGKMIDGDSTPNSVNLTVVT